MSKGTINIRYDALISSINLISDIIKREKILEMSSKYLNAVKYYVDTFNWADDVDNKETICVYNLDLVDAIKVYIENGMDISTGIGIPPIIDYSTTSISLGVDDMFSYIRVSNVGDITVTIPLNTTAEIEIGSYTEFEQASTGVITFVGEGGVTLNSFDSSYQSAGQYSTMGLKKVDTDEWTLYGLLV
jgi:hypothetical protein